MRLAYSFVCGLIFGLGLCLSGMIQPSKVQAFLDIAGRWDPTLAFVMAGAVAVGALFFRAASRRNRSLVGDPIRQPGEDIDAPLLIGSSIFGVGWGLSGVCPGPSVANLAFFDAHAAMFFVAMIVGMALERPSRRLSAATLARKEKRA
jgi:uncharacterized membrane protein YedE/YeeE